MLICQKKSYVNPVNIMHLVHQLSGSIFLHNASEPSSDDRYSFIAIKPLKIFNTEDLSGVLQEFKYFIDLNYNNQYDNLPPFIGGLMGYCSYDLITNLEERIHTAYTKNQNLHKNHHINYPKLQFGLYNQIFAFDNFNKITYIIINKFLLQQLNNNTQQQLEEISQQQLNELINIYNTARDLQISNIYNSDSKIILPKMQMQSNFSKYQYIQAINIAKEYIKNGDIFEINLSQCYSSVNQVYNYPTWELFKQTIYNSPTPFMAYINFKNLTIISASPERFVKINNNIIETKPIKGTIARLNNTKLDLINQQTLSNSIKDIAENTMIVDLLRNDLSKICISESIRVKELCKLYSFHNVHHLISTIQGKLSPKNNIFDFITNLFPGGSITGAPKIRAMQIIQELEKIPRGIYCGCIAYFSCNNKVDSSIAIRTIIYHNQQLKVAAGGAITLLSNPDDEYEETEIKINKLLKILQC